MGTSGLDTDLTNRLLTAEGTVVNNGTLKQIQLVNQGVTTMVSGNQFCQGRSAGIKRCYDITPDSTQNATVRFDFTETKCNRKSLVEMKVLHHAATWVMETGTTTSGGLADQARESCAPVWDFL